MERDGKRWGGVGGDGKGRSEMGRDGEGMGRRGGTYRREMGIVSGWGVSLPLNSAWVRGKGITGVKFQQTNDGFAVAIASCSPHLKS